MRLFFFGIPIILAFIIIILFHGHFSIIDMDAIFLALAIFTPIMFNSMLSIFSIDKELLRNEKDHAMVKKFRDNVSFIIVICLISIFLVLLKILFAELIGVVSVFLEFIIVCNLLIIGLNLLEVLNKVSFLTKERLLEIKPKK